MAVMEPVLGGEARDVLSLQIGAYRSRLALSDRDIARGLVLRQRLFRNTAAVSDADGYDARCHHVLIETTAGELLACFRLLPLPGGASILTSYSAQFYDLAALVDYPGPVLELGRFCVDPDVHDPDVLRIAWAAMTRFVDATGTRLLFGCSSFAGADSTAHSQALAYLGHRHLAPPQWRPGKKPGQGVALPEIGEISDRAVSGIPPLLRTYLAMGGWVSDHAVPDSDLDTLHVFTGVEIDRIPAARARALRALASA